MFGKSKWKVGDIIEPLLDEEQFAERETLACSKEQQQVEKLCCRILGAAGIRSDSPPSVPDFRSSARFLAKGSLEFLVRYREKSPRLDC